MCAITSNYSFMSFRLDCLKWHSASVIRSLVLSVIAYRSVVFSSVIHIVKFLEFDAKLSVYFVR